MHRQPRSGDRSNPTDLGGGLVKKWIGWAGQGKSGDFRMPSATNKGNRWVFVFGFPACERTNVEKDEAEVLLKVPAHLLSLTAQAIDRQI